MRLPRRTYMLPPLLALGTALLLPHSFVRLVASVSPTSCGHATALSKDPDASPDLKNQLDIFRSACPQATSLEMLETLERRRRW